MTYCEDYPGCGHTDGDPCPGRSVISEPWFCDYCGMYHYGECPGDSYDEDWCVENDEAVATDCPLCGASESSAVIAQNGGMCETCRIERGY